MRSHFFEYAWSLGLLLNAEFDPNLLSLNVPVLYPVLVFAANHHQ
jgi:hypothetical protein